MKERVSIAKKSRALNPLQFNALAIVLLIGFLPFTVAFITNAGSSTSDNYEDSMADGVIVPSSYESKWIANGGENWTWYYQNLNFYGNSIFEYDCIYVIDGYCQGVSDPPQYEFPLSSGYYGNQFQLPMTSNIVRQTHFTGSNGNNYVGSSGSDEFAMRLGSEYFSNVAQNTTMDKIKFTFVEPFVSYNCDHSIFQNISFTSAVTFEYDGKRKTYSGFDIVTDNKYRYNQYNNQNGQFGIVCVLGFDVEFDLTGFESLELSEFNRGQWNETIVEISMTNFENEDDTLAISNFGTTALPFAGDNFFYIGIEHQELNSKQAGFIIRGATLLLAIVTFVIAIASTPYWDPFRGFFEGRL